MFEIITAYSPELEKKTAKLAPRIYMRLSVLLFALVMIACGTVLLAYREQLMAAFVFLGLFLTLIPGIIAIRKGKRDFSTVCLQTATFTENGLTVVSSSGNTYRYSFDQFRGVYDSDALIILEIERTLIFLDKVGFQEGNPEELLTFLAPKANQKTKAQKRRFLLRILIENLVAIALVALYLFFAKGACGTDVKQHNASKEEQYIKVLISIDDTTKVDVSDRIREAQTILPDGRLLDPNAALLALGKDVYISLSRWGELPTTEATYYLPMLIYREADGWETSWYGDYSVDLSGSDPSTRHAAGAFFAQRAGDKTVINIGTRYLEKQNADSSLLRDSFGQSPAELSASLVEGFGDQSAGWIIMSSLSSEIQSGSPQFVAMTPMERETGLVFVVQDLTDDYLIQCGEWSVTGAEIRTCLENPDFSSDSVRLN